MTDPYGGICEMSRGDAEELPDAIPEGVSLVEQIVGACRMVGDVSLIRAPLRRLVEEMPLVIRYRYATALPCYFRGVPLVDGELVEVVT